MSETYTKKPPILFWILAIAFILWGLMGCGMYLAEMMMSDEAYAEAFGADLAAVRDVYPTWGLAGYATAVWSGLLASILFTLRSLDFFQVLQIRFYETRRELDFGSCRWLLLC
jgi:hypothetical protein